MLTVYSGRHYFLTHETSEFIDVKIDVLFAAEKWK
jgi:hypothetical protein